MHPEPTEWIVLVVAILMIISVLARSLASRFGLPALLGFLALGMIAGSEGLGGIHFSDFGAAQATGVIALVLILYAGGLGVRTEGLKRTLVPAILLATLGVAFSTAIVAGAGMLAFQWTPLQAMLFGAIVSSTDAAAVFASLKGNNLHLTEDVETLIELESGSNDPTAVFLVATSIALIENVAMPIPGLFAAYGVEMAVGAAIGAAVGLSFAFLVRKTDSGLPHPHVVLSLAAPLAAFGLAGTIGGNGFLAAFVAGVAVAHRQFNHKEAVNAFIGAVAWLAQVAMFLVLGLLVFPSSLPSTAPIGFLMTVVILFVARPASVFLCLAPFRRFDWKAKLFISWAGLRGAVPIVLATFPMLAGVNGAVTVFNTVFFVVLLSSVLQGPTLGWLAKRLGVSRDEMEIAAGLADGSGNP
jgi:cell volume regulation protein A